MKLKSKKILSEILIMKGLGMNMVTTKSVGQAEQLKMGYSNLYRGVAPGVVVCVLTSFLATPLLASSIHCEYEDKITSVIESKISGVRNIQKQIYPYKDETRKCFIDLEVQIDGKWIPTSGSKVFDGDVSANKACDQAKIKAKKSLLEKLGIETIRNTKDKQCTEVVAKNTCQKYTKFVNVQGRRIKAWGTLCNVNGEWVKR